MSSLITNATIQIRKDTAGNWTSNNPTPAAGEWCYETDTKYIKIGDGSTAWTSLVYTAKPNPPTLTKFTGAWTICTAWTAGNSITINHALNTSFDELIGQIFVRDPAVPGKIYNVTNLDEFNSTAAQHLGQRLNGINNDLDNLYLQIASTLPRYINDSGTSTNIVTTWYYKIVVYKLS